MASVSPPKPWERAGAGAVASAGAMSQPQPQPTASLSSQFTTTSSAPGAPPVPQRPSTLASAVNTNASAYSPYGATGVGASPYSSGIGAMSSPYSRLGGMGGGYGSSMYGGMGGGYGSSMYGGMGSSMYGGMGGGYGMGGMGGYGGMGGVGGMNGQDPNSLTNTFSQSTQATFHVIESIVGAFGGFAQMLESTYMATHSSFFAMVSVAEQFSTLKTTLGSILGIFTLLRWLRTLLAKITGRPPPVDATSLTPGNFAKFAGLPPPPPQMGPDGRPVGGQRLSKKPFVMFIVAAFGLPYLMGKLIRSMAANQEAAERARLESQGVQFDANGQPIPAAAMHPSQLDYCRVLYDFTPDNGAAVQGVDLAVKKGDLVAVLSRSDPLGNASEWWRCRARDGRVGYLPGVYLSEVKKGPAPVAGQQQITAKGEASRTSTMSSVGNGASGFGMSGNQPGFGMGGQPPVVSGKAGDITAESFQKSQFYS